MEGISGNSGLILNDPGQDEPNQEVRGQEQPSGPSSEASLAVAPRMEEPSSAPRSAESGQPSPEVERAITGFQSQLRGHLARSHVNVSAVGNSGIVHVQIKGDSDTFARVGMENLNTDNGPKELHYLRVPSEKFQAHVVGGDSLYFDEGKAAEYGLQSQQSLVTNSSLQADEHAYVNGGYFNVVQRASTDAPDHTPIGKTRTTGGKRVPYLPVPMNYVDDYRKLKLHGDSMIKSGPVLSEKGRETFPQDKLNDPKYQYQGDDRDQPGILKHAQHPNPRSGVSLPGARSTEDAFRLAVGLSRGNRGPESIGFIMPDWSTVMARLDRLNQTPGASLNLDGGSSSALGVINSKAEKLVDERENNRQAVSTIIAFSSVPETTSSDENVASAGREGERGERREVKRKT